MRCTDRSEDFGELSQVHLKLYSSEAPSPWLDQADLAPVPLPLTDSTVQAVLASAPPDELDESDLSSSDSGIYVALDPDGRAMSTSGYGRWPCDIAHVGVLTRPSARGQHYARSAASFVLAQATDHGLLVQWRAAESNPGSVALARSLGLAQLGWQVSFKPAIPMTRRSGV